MYRNPPPHRPRDPATVSRLMSAVRATGNRAEVALRKKLWAWGIRYRLYGKGLPGRPDIVIRNARTVIFVDGDFWHGRLLVERGERALIASIRTPRAPFWISKIKRNAERDVMQNEQLGALGWRVIRVWERDVLADVNACARYITHLVRGCPRSAQPTPRFVPSPSVRRGTPHRHHGTASATRRR
jgi:DNA mismatch endonuclease, patch repair protein